MSEESARHHHHHHSSGSHHSGSSRYRSRRRSRRRAADAAYEQQRAIVDEIVTQNIGTLQAVLHRKVFLLAVSGLIGAGAVFLLIWSRHHEGSLLRASITSIAALACWFIGVKLFQAHKSSMIDMKALIQFQETRVDSLKVSLAQQEKTIQGLTERLRTCDPDGGAEPKPDVQDYRKLSGLS